MPSHTLIFRTHSSSRYSVAALLGSIETDERLIDLHVQAPLDLSMSSITDTLSRGSVIVAYSVMSTQTDSVYQETNQLRSTFKSDITIVGGGAHATARPDDLLRNGFDYVVVGEGEQTFRDLVLRLLNDEDPASISGVVANEMEVYPQPSQLPRVNLDTYPPFALELNVVGPVEITRGCPFSCKFCCTPFLTGGRVRHRTPESIVHWLTRAVNERGFKRTWFLSPNALCYGGHGRKAHSERMEHLLMSVSAIEGLEEVYCGSFPSEVRPEFVTRPLLKMLRHYVANKSLQIGIQSGSDRVLEIANRHHSVEDGMQAVHIALESGFIPHVDMIFGLPGELEDDRELNRQLCQDLIDIGARVHGHVFMPLPGSAFEEKPPGTLDTETRRFLGELARKKQLTGSWSNQETIAKQLAGIE